MEPCNVVNSILRIKCSLNLLISYICFNNCGSAERASLCAHHVQMQFPKTFCPLCDKQVIARVLGKLRINFTCIFKVLPKIALVTLQLGKFWETLKIHVKLIRNCWWSLVITCTNRTPGFKVE